MVASVVRTIGDSRVGRWIRVGFTPARTLSLAFLTLGGFVAGVFFWGGFNTVLEATNTEQFCVSCHEMRANVFEELKGTIHFTNRSGVRARARSSASFRISASMVLRPSNRSRSRTRFSSSRSLLAHGACWSRPHPRRHGRPNVRLPASGASRRRAGSARCRHDGRRTRPTFRAAWSLRPGAPSRQWSSGAGPERM
jgi:NapC/NirT cytochrome c family, N-terminal region